MEDGEEQIEFASAAEATAGIEAMYVDKAEREKLKSNKFEKNKNKSEEDESGQNKRRISEGAHTSVPDNQGKRRTSSKGCYGPIKETTRREPNKETKKALATYITATNNNNTDSPTNSNTHKEQTTFNSLLPDHPQQTAAPPRTHR